MGLVEQMDGEAWLDSQNFPNGCIFSEFMNFVKFLNQAGGGRWVGRGGGGYFNPLPFSSIGTLFENIPSKDLPKPKPFRVLDFTVNPVDFAELGNFVDNLHQTGMKFVPILGKQ